MKKYTGFSLIELMIVIAIIGILAAIAVPAYRKYSASTSATQAIPFMEEIISKMITYASIHGSFPSAHQLNMGNATFPSAFTYMYAGYGLVFNSMYAKDTSDKFGFTANCGQSGMLSAIIAPASPGILAASINCLLVHKKSAIETLCTYVYEMNQPWGPSRGSLGSWVIAPGSTGDIFPGWTNVLNVAGSQAAFNAFAAGSSCM